MKHIPILRYGEANSLKVRDYTSTQIEQIESLQDDEILIEVHFSGINFADIVMRLGFYPDAPPKPFTPGYEISGVVFKVGSKVTRHKVGDKVFAGTFFGGYSNYVKIPEWQVLKLPTHLTLEEAAGIPVAFITSYNALFRMGRVCDGDKLMLDCASGGVGLMALSLLKDKKVDVVGLTSSPSKKSLIESFCSRAMTHDEFMNSNEKDFDFILNSQGGKTIRKHFSRLGQNGRIVCLGVSDGIKDGKKDYFQIIKTVVSMPWFSVTELFNHNKGVFALNALHLMEDHVWIKKRMNDFDLIEKLKIKPFVGAVYKADEVVEAHRALESRKAKGKILLQWR